MVGASLQLFLRNVVQGDVETEGAAAASVVAASQCQLLLPRSLLTRPPPLTH